MPEAAMDEDHRSVLWKNEIRFPWQARLAQPVPQAACVKSMPDLHFDGSVPGAHSRHLRGSTLGRNGIQLRRPCDALVLASGLPCRR